MTAESSGYVRSIDGLRGIAIALVLFNHAGQLLVANDVAWPEALWRRAPGAWQGVDLFFVVSGFLITRILLGLRESEAPFRRFWWRRALRIFPLAALYLVVLFGFSFVSQTYASLHDPKQLALVAGYATNIQIALEGWLPPGLTILWSLAVEEHFYLFWPLLALKLSRRRLWVVLNLIILSTPLLRAICHAYLGTTAVYVLTFCRWDALAAGAVVAMVWTSPMQPVAARWAQRLLPFSALVVGAILAVPFGPSHASSPPLFEAFGYSALAFAYAIITAAALGSEGWLNHLLSSKVLVEMGKRCYGLYIWHVLAAELVLRVDRRVGGTSFGLRIAEWAALTAVAAALSHRYYETYFLRYKMRFA